MEKIIVQQLSGYLCTNCLLYNHQYGFRKGHSTLQRILEAKSCKIPEATLAIFLDLKKAFDTVSHSILLKKLELYGVRGKELEWFRSYLKDRLQIVKVGDKESGQRWLRTGVPQGSCLGPLLFLIYINDMPRACQLLSILFADDTTLQASGPDVVDLCTSVNAQLNLASEWFNANKLTLHPSKTKFIYFNGDGKKSPVSLPPLVLNGHQIERVGEDCKSKSIKFLGLWLDENLNWGHHCSHVARKIQSTIAVIARLKRLLSPPTRLLVYNSLVRSHLEYLLPVWGNAKKGLLRPISNLQKRCIRTTFGLRFTAHTSGIFKKFKLLKFEHLYKNALLKIAHDIFYARAPPPVVELLHRPELARNYNFKPYKLPPRNVFLKDMPGPMLVREWNTLAPELRSILSRKVFCNELYASFLNKYNEHCHIIQCYTCNNS